MEQRLPNLISYEGVRGLEQGGCCRPDNSIWLPFMRNAVGPMDFTPGAMENAQPNENRGTGDRPMGEEIACSLSPKPYEASAPSLVKIEGKFFVLLTEKLVERLWVSSCKALLLMSMCATCSTRR